MPQQITDTHVHIWQLGQSPYKWLNGLDPLNRTYDIRDFETERIETGITAGVLVQADNTLEDTDWMLKVAAENKWIKGIAGWLPLTDPVAAARLLEDNYGHHPLFKGVRHLIHNEADPKWLLQDTVIESLELLVKYDLGYDLVGVLPQHIETALELAQKVPGLRMIFDHLNQPPIASKEKFGRWGVLMQEAAANKNFYIKISGMGTTVGGKYWSADDISPYIEFVIEHFGEERCCCGGDWPVCLLAGSYSYTWLQYKTVLGRLLSVEGEDKVYNSNAERFYKL